MTIQEPVVIQGYNINDPKQNAELLEKLWDQINNQHVMPKDALQFTDQMMEDLYSMAYNLYNAGKIKKALDIFRHLMILDFKSFRYAYATGACCQQLKDYLGASCAYAVAILDEPTNPIPMFYSAECAMEVGNKDAAEKYLTAFITLASDMPQLTHLVERAKLLREGLKEDNKIKGKKK